MILFTAPKIQNQHRCSSTDERISVYVHSLVLLSYNKDEILSFPVNEYRTRNKFSENVN